jgi:hypothetical protein
VNAEHIFDTAELWRSFDTFFNKPLWHGGFMLINDSLQIALKDDINDFAEMDISTIAKHVLNFYAKEFEKNKEFYKFTQEFIDPIKTSSIELKNDAKGKGLIRFRGDEKLRGHYEQMRNDMFDVFSLAIMEIEKEYTRENAIAEKHARELDRGGAGKNAPLITNENKPKPQKTDDPEYKQSISQIFRGIMEKPERTK